MMRRLYHWSLLLAVAAIAAGASGAADRTGASAEGPVALLGIWVPDSAPRALLTASGKAPPLTVEASKLYDERRQRLARGDASFDPTSWCAGPGMPRILTMKYPLEIRADANRVVFIHGWYRWFRTVDLGAGAVDPPLPLTMGFPVGHWEQNTLVIRTVGLIDTTVMDASGLPHSERLTLTERLRVLPDRRLEDRITIDDPENYTQPWETVLTFHRDAAARVADDVCPDRMAAGEPAEQVSSTRSSVSRSTPPASRAAAVTATPVSSAPGLAGIWEPKTFGFLVPDAPLSAAGAEIVTRNATAMQSGKIMQTAWVSCRPGAVSTMTMPREKIVILESGDEVTMLFEMPRMVRRIRLNGLHPQKLEPSYVGDSIGRWEGNTLVVDTLGFNGYAELDARGEPTSAKLHTVERFAPSADGNSIDIDTTIEDPEYYTRPFIIKRSWKRSPARHPFEYDCMENPRQEDFENAYYVRERYRPVCMRVEGAGMTPSTMVCGRKE
ncbi:MAG TPA: hypothetical protein VMC02_09090 [Steroidobacteraceae bacterium]|nr:hypothetical protein [Steroidobacteraceae bacterium]